eukprot:gene2572-3534_t
MNTNIPFNFHTASDRPLGTKQIVVWTSTETVSTKDEKLFLSFNPKHNCPILLFGTTKLFGKPMYIKKPEKFQLYKQNIDKAILEVEKMSFFDNDASRVFKECLNQLKHDGYDAYSLFVKNFESNNSSAPKTKNVSRLIPLQQQQNSFNFQGPQNSYLYELQQHQPIAGVYPIQQQLMSNLKRSFSIDDVNYENEKKKIKLNNQTSLSTQTSSKMENNNGIEIGKITRIQPIVDCKPENSKCQQLHDFMYAPFAYFPNLKISFEEKKELYQSFKKTIQEYNEKKSISEDEAFKIIDQIVAKNIEKSTNQQIINLLENQNSSRKYFKELFIEKLNTAKKERKISLEFSKYIMDITLKKYEEFPNFTEDECLQLILGDVFSDWCSMKSKFIQELDKMIDFENKIKKEIGKFILYFEIKKGKINEPIDFFEFYPIVGKFFSMMEKYFDCEVEPNSMTLFIEKEQESILNEKLKNDLIKKDETINKLTETFLKKDELIQSLQQQSSLLNLPDFILIDDDND